MNKISIDDYLRFIERFSEVLANDHPDCCYYSYGSLYEPNEFVSGISDHDGGIALSSGVISPKPKLLDIAQALDDCAGNSGIDLEYSLTDRRTSRDGRFLSYALDMTGYLQRDARVLSGPKHLLREMNGLDYKKVSLDFAANNFSRNLRSKVLTSYLDLRMDRRRFNRGVLGNMKKAIKFPKQLVLIKTDRLYTKKAQARDAFKELVGDVDLSLVIEVQNLLRNPVRLEKALRSDETAVNFLVKSLEAVEIMIEAYLDKFPEVDYNECRM